MAVIAIHPGEHLAEELKELGMSAAELARKQTRAAGLATAAPPGSARFSPGASARAAVSAWSIAR